MEGGKGKIFCWLRHYLHGDTSKGQLSPLLPCGSGARLVSELASSLVWCNTWLVLHSLPTPSPLSAEWFEFNGLNLKSLATKDRERGKYASTSTVATWDALSAGNRDAQSPTLCGACTQMVKIIFVTNASLSLQRISPVFPHSPRFSFNTVI